MDEEIAYKNHCEYNDFDRLLDLLILAWIF